MAEAAAAILSATPAEDQGKQQEELAAFEGHDADIPTSAQPAEEVRQLAAREGSTSHDSSPSFANKDNEVAKDDDASTSNGSKHTGDTKAKNI